MMTANEIRESYKQFFAKAGFEEVQYKLIKGKLPCAIAVIGKRTRGEIEIEWR